MNPTWLPLFSFEIVALLPHGHALCAKPWLEAGDFADQTLIAYPVTDDMLDLVRCVLAPAGVTPARRTTELTIARLQLWAAKGYLDRGYVARQRIGAQGLTGRLYPAVAERLRERPYVAEFVRLMRETSLLSWPGVTLL